jgi:hypothetical protein
MASCHTVQLRALTAGTGIANAGVVRSFFMAGSDRVTWEIVTVADDETYRLSVVHPKGTIVEYFSTTAGALRREQELEAMFLTNRQWLPAKAS